MFLICFNTQPPEGGWDVDYYQYGGYEIVSTHSRLKAAGDFTVSVYDIFDVSTHSRLKAAGVDRYNVAVAALRFQHTAA